MAAATERIPVLVTPAEKRQIARMAKAAGMSMGEYLRRAAASFQPSDDDAILEGMIAQMAKTTANASAAIDRALAFVEASNKRIKALEAKKRAA
jgi:hypothetical protein